MKNFYLFIIIIVIFNCTVQAQKGILVGAKAGLNLNMIDGQSFSNVFDLTYHLGGFAELGFNKKWRIQPEILWNQTSGTIESFNTIYPTLTSPSGSEYVKLNYLSIPLLLGYHFNKWVVLQVGPQFGILINEKNTLMQNGQSAFKNGDFGLVSGLQFNLKHIRLYSRYTIGLMSINDIDNKEKWTNQQLQFGVGIRL